MKVFNSSMKTLLSSVKDLIFLEDCALIEFEINNIKQRK